MPEARRKSLNPIQKSGAVGQTRHRLQLDFTPESYAHLMKLKEQSCARSNTDLIEKALQLYGWYLEKKQEKQTLQVASPDGTIEKVVLLGLQ